MTDTNPSDETPTRPSRDVMHMRLAVTQAARVRLDTAPNPWVGAVVVSADDRVVGRGATEPPGGRHAEIVALDEAGPECTDATMYVSLEPCCHHGRTPPCTEAIIAAGIQRVVIGVLDPDTNVGGQGVAALRAAGIDVVLGVESASITAQLRAYLHHRTTGRPFVYCKIAASLDGGTAAADGTSQWITGGESRVDGHRLRAESGVIVVGAGTVRADDPSLTVRHVDGPDPQRVVLGSAPPGARVHPCVEWHGPLDELLDDLGRRGVLQVLVEGGATILRSFLNAELVDRFVVYVAPALFTGTNAHPFIGGPTAGSIDDLWRGCFDSVDRLGNDLRIELIPERPAPAKAARPLAGLATHPNHQHETQE